LGKIGPGLTKAFANRYPRRRGPTASYSRSNTLREGFANENLARGRLLSVFVLLTLQFGSTISASSGGQLRKSVARKTKNPNGGKKLWDYSIQYSVQLVEKVTALAVAKQPRS
jgi:hypothetical protein